MGAKDVDWSQGPCSTWALALHHMEKVQNNEQETVQLPLGQGLSFMSSQNYTHMLYIPHILGHQGPRQHIFKSLGPKGKPKLHGKGNYQTGKKNNHFYKSLFFSCSSHSNALKGITVYIVQSIWRKYLNLLIISKWDYKQRENKSGSSIKGKITEYSLLFTSLF